MRQRPGIDGLEFLNALRMKGVSEQMPVALMSSAPELDQIRINAYQAGVIEILNKSIHPHELVLRIKNLSRLAPAWLSSSPTPGWNPNLGGLLCAQDAQAITMILQAGLSPSELDFLRLLGGLMSTSKLQHLAPYSVQMARYAAALGIAYGLNLRDQGRLLLAAPFYNIGKIGVPERLLHKKGPLLGDEKTMMNQFPHLGHDLLSRVNLPIMKASAEIAHSHQERWDGRGEPQGLQSKSIPIFARIVAVADAFETMTRDRICSRQSIANDIKDNILIQSGKKFDPAVVRALVHSQDNLLLIKTYFDEQNKNNYSNYANTSARLH
jgi:putative two-component system response regulator